MKLKRFIKNNIIFLIVLFLFIFILYKYNIKDNFTNPICRTNNISCAEKQYDIIICLGQSNMVGSSISDNVTNTDYTNDLNYVIDEKVDKVTFDTNSPTTIRICKSQETSSNFSMATSFGREYARVTNKNVLIINVAKRSTGILRRANVNSAFLWQLRDTAGGIGLYPLAKDFINRVKMKICNRSNVVAICYQGSEEDSYLSNLRGHICGYQVYDNTYINNYNTKMSELLNAFKTDIGDSNTKIMVGGLKLENTNRPCSKYFTNSVIKEVARINNYIFISSDSNTNSNKKYLQRKLDGSQGVHFNKLSQIELGKRYAHYYFN